MGQAPMIILSRYCLLTVFMLSLSDPADFMSSWAAYYPVSICRRAVSEAGSEMAQNCPLSQALECN